MRRLLLPLALAALVPTAGAAHVATADSGTLECRYTASVGGAVMAQVLPTCTLVSKLHRFDAAPAGTYRLTVSWSPVATDPPGVFDRLNVSLTPLHCTSGGGGGISGTVCTGAGRTASATDTSPIVLEVPANADLNALRVQVRVVRALELVRATSSLPPQDVAWTIGHAT